LTDVLEKTQLGKLEKTQLGKTYVAYECFIIMQQRNMSTIYGCSIGNPNSKKIWPKIFKGITLLPQATLT